MDRRLRRHCRLSLRKHFRRSLKYDHVERTIPNRSLSIISTSASDAETSEEDSLNSSDDETLCPTNNTKYSRAHLPLKARNKSNFEDVDLKNNNENLLSDKENSIELLYPKNVLKVQKTTSVAAGSPNGSDYSAETKKPITSNQEYVSSHELIVRNVCEDKSKKKKVPKEPIKILDSSSSSSSSEKDCHEGKKQKNRDKKFKDTSNKYQGPKPSKKKLSENNKEDEDEKNEKIKEKLNDTKKNLPKSLKEEAGSVTYKVKNYIYDAPMNIKKKGLRKNSRKKLDCFESSLKTDDYVEDLDESDSRQRNKNNKTYSFLASLSCNIPNDKCDPSARIYKENFKNTREELAMKLLYLYNEHIFNNAIPKETLVKWNPRLTSSAGYCATKRIIHRDGKIDYDAQIVLSTKVLTTPERLRDTLVHELCHAVTWVVDNIIDGHGTHWKAWTKKVRIAFPELPPIKISHNYEIQSKYVYKCSGCGYSIKRHRKSLDIERKICEYCHGKFELFINKSSKNGQQKLITADTSVQENNSKYKNKNSADVIRLLSEDFKELKVNHYNLRSARKNEMK